MPLRTFWLDGDHDIELVENTTVTDGVTCDVYRFTADAERDLGVVGVRPGCRTPLQRVLAGDSTLEGLLSGRGRLTVTKPDGQVHVHDFADPRAAPVSVGIGDLMQWHADAGAPLVFFEVCAPPYEPGRFQDLPGFAQ